LNEKLFLPSSHDLEALDRWEEARRRGNRFSVLDLIHPHPDPPPSRADLYPHLTQGVFYPFPPVSSV